MAGLLLPKIMMTKLRSQKTPQLPKRKRKEVVNLRAHRLKKRAKVARPCGHEDVSLPSLPSKNRAKL